MAMTDFVHDMKPSRPFIRTFSPAEAVPAGVILPRQVHGSRIVEITDGAEDLDACDGLWTSRPDILLGVRTADCAPVAVWDASRIGIVHVGWRGLVGDALCAMLALFDQPSVWIGPLLPAFEIKRDFCHDAIVRRFGHAFLDEHDGAIVFRFFDALRSVVPHATTDPRATDATPALASWRRDRSEARNVTAIGMIPPHS